jgi:hypothetical protein
MSVEAVEPVQSDISARLDRLPWSKWHWLEVIGLGSPGCRRGRTAPPGTTPRLGESY